MFDPWRPLVVLCRSLCRGLESVLNFIERVCPLLQKIVSASLRLFSATFNL